MTLHAPSSTPFPYTTLFRSGILLGAGLVLLGITLYNPLPRSHALNALPLPQAFPSNNDLAVVLNPIKVEDVSQFQAIVDQIDRKSTRLNSSHPSISYAVFCL